MGPYPYPLRETHGPPGQWSSSAEAESFFDAGGSTSRPTLGRPVVQCPPHI